MHVNSYVNIDNSDEHVQTHSITRAFAARTHLGPIVVSERTQRKGVDGSSDKIDLRRLAQPDKHAHCCIGVRECFKDNSDGSRISGMYKGACGADFISFFLNIP